MTPSMGQIVRRAVDAKCPFFCPRNLLILRTPKNRLEHISPSPRVGRLRRNGGSRDVLLRRFEPIFNEIDEKIDQIPARPCRTDPLFMRVLSA